MKASLSSPKAISIRGLRRVYFAGQDLIRNDRCGYREQRQDRYDRHRSHGNNVAADCGRKCQSLAHFQDQAGKQSWPQARVKAYHPLPASRRSAGLTAIGQAAPIQARAKRGGQAIPARRLGHDQPEAKENGDQRHAEQQPQVHFKPMLFARDIAETAGIGVSRSFQ
jgi:hypothetical protein